MHATLARSDPAYGEDGGAAAAAAAAAGGGAPMLRKSQSAVELGSWRSLSGAVEELWGADAADNVRFGLTGARH